MNRLLMLNEELVNQASQNTVRSGFPIAAKRALPISPFTAWKEKENRLAKAYKFDDLEERNSFLFQLLSYEYEKGHSASIKIEEKIVIIEVHTKDLNKITEVDREYARSTDQIYKEVKDATARRTSSYDE